MERAGKHGDHTTQHDEGTAFRPGDYFSGLLGEYGLLKQVIRSLVEDNVLLSPELPTETSAIWLRQRAKEIKRKNPAKAKAMLVRSLDMRPSKDTASVLLSLLIKLGDMKEAKVLIDAQSKGKKGQAGFVPSVLRLAQENNLV